MSPPRCPRCGEPARVVVLLKARVRCELEPDCKVGRVLSTSRENNVAGYECGGEHYWKEVDT